MRRLEPVCAVAAALVILVAGGCRSSSDAVAPETSQAPDASTQAPPTTSAASTEASPEPATAETRLEDFDPDAFGSSTVVDNEWLPLAPGTQVVLEGSTVEGGRRVPHRVVSIVTDLAKTIEGVHTVVVWERDFAGGKLVETELAFFAQDDEGNVWHFGQYPEEYERGELVEAPAWIAGIQNARPGIAMKAEARAGTPSYSQGWAPAVDWTDRGRVYRTGRHTCVPLDCYDDVLVMEEFSQEEPDAFQLKYYARGVGNVRVGWRGEDPSKETLVLVGLARLAPAELARARQAALAQEARAYEISREVYGRTAPAERR